MDTIEGTRQRDLLMRLAAARDENRHMSEELEALRRSQQRRNEWPTIALVLALFSGLMLSWVIVLLSAAHEDCITPTASVNPVGYWGQR